MKNGIDVWCNSCISGADVLCSFMAEWCWCMMQSTQWSWCMVHNCIMVLVYGGNHRMVHNIVLVHNSVDVWCNCCLFLHIGVGVYSYTLMLVYGGLSASGI